MRLTSLSLTNLRNIKEARIEPGPGLNVLHGDNGAGKTTVLEALVVLAKGRSFRTGPLSSLIGTGDSLFRIVADIESDDESTHRLGIERDRSGWQGRLDGEALKSVTSAAHLLPLVIMEPNSHALVSGSPEHRRRFLDWSVFHVKHDFLIDWRRYGRALRQRNAALRSGDRTLVASLDPQVADLGEALTRRRRAVFEQLGPKICSILGDLSPRLEDPEILFRPGWSEPTLAEALGNAMNRDLELGQTRVGPHRADLAFRVRGRAVRDRLSRGEQKILAAASLLAQGELFVEGGHVPLMLLDDLASEFDAEHLGQVIHRVEHMNAQQFVTGTDPAPYKDLELPSHRMFHV